MNILISCGRDTARYGAYARAVAAGGVPTLEYLPSPLTEGFSGLILAGGGDVDPTLYHGENRACRGVDLPRDLAELALLDAFLGAGRPVLGICKGQQVANVWAGGTLIQDLAPGGVTHALGEGDAVHEITPQGDSLLRRLYGAGPFPVNSAHHQGVGRPGRGMTVTARAADGVAEAMEHARLPLFTTQFHPERMTGAGTVAGGLLFAAFLGLCGEK